MKEKYKETELYAPVADFLISKGFNVHSEVNGCDVAAVKGDALVIVELKTAFNLKLITQVTDRLTVTDYVYAAVPRPDINSKNGVSSRYFNEVLTVFKRLEVGLLLVALDSPMKTVEPVLHPMSYHINKSKVNRLKIISEIDGRLADFNTGGSSRSKLITAYREKSIHIACVVKKKGTATKRQLNLIGFDKREAMLIYHNYYGWFERVQKGVYTLSESGRQFIENPDDKFREIVEYYIKAANTEE